MTEKIEHTFVIPAYKDSPYIGECIESLKKQTVKSEIIISTSTPSKYFDNVAKKYGLKLYAGKKKGMAADWSFAYSLAKTKYVTLAHQDDIYNPDYTAECLKLTGDLGLVSFTDYDEIDSVGNIRQFNVNLIIKRIILFPFDFTRSYKNKIIKKKLFALGNPFCGPSCFFNKELIGNFEFDDSLLFTTDWDAWLRIGNLDGEFSFVWKKLLKHRIYSESETSRQIKTNNRVVEEYRMLRQQWPEKVAKFISKNYANGQLSNEIR